MVMIHWGPDVLRLVAGLLVLGVVGAAACRLSGLRVPRCFALPYQVVCGQLLLVLYVYLRTAVCDFLPFELPGVTGAELYTLVLAGVIVLARGELARWGGLQPATVFPWVLWFTWLCIFARKKIGLLYTPSSDPDLHAFFARHFLHAGKILYGEIPGTDVLFSYPAGFAVLNQVWAALTGLTPVQIVNLQCYVQYLLFLGMGYAMLGRARLPQLARFGLVATLFILLPLLLNPVWLHGREYLEGTARLSHTAMLFFPLAFLFENRGRARRRWARVVAVVVLSICYGVAISPAHFLAVVVLAVVSILAFGGSRPRFYRRVRSRHWAAGLALTVAIPTLFLWFDPYYRPYLINPALFGDRSFQDKRWGSIRKVVQDRPLLAEGSAAQLLPAVAGEVLRLDWTSIPGKPPVLQQATGQTVWVAGGVLLLCWLVPWRRRIPPRMRRYMRLAGITLAFGLVTKVTNGVLVAFISAETLNGQMFLSYVRAIEFQGLSLLYHLVLCLPWVACGVLLQGARGGSPGWVAVALAVALIAPASYCAIDVARDSRHFYSRLSRTSMGQITADDLELLKWAEAHIPADERVLLPGVVVQAPLENWIFPFRTSRAAGLYSNLRTAFFFGIDGQEYDAGSYLERVQEHFDREWLEQRKIRWTFGIPEFPPEHLARHFRLVKQVGDSSLWRLTP